VGLGKILKYALLKYVPPPSLYFAKKNMTHPAPIPIYYIIINGFTGI